MPELGDRLDDVFARALAKEPAERPASAVRARRGRPPPDGARADHRPAGAPARGRRARAGARRDDRLGGGTAARAACVGSAARATGAACWAWPSPRCAARPSSARRGSRSAATVTAAAAQPAPAVADVPGLRYVGSPLAGAPGRALDCRGRPAAATSPGCTVVQSALPGATVVVPEDGVDPPLGRARRAAARCRCRSCASATAARSRSRSPTPRRSAARTSSGSTPTWPWSAATWSRCGCRRARRSGSATRRAGATTERWIPRWRGFGRAADRGRGHGVRPRAAAARRRRCPARARRPRGRRRARRPRHCPTAGSSAAARCASSGRSVEVALVQVGRRFRLDEFIGDRRRARIEVPGMRPRAQVDAVRACGVGAGARRRGRELRQRGERARRPATYVVTIGAVRARPVSCRPARSIAGFRIERLIGRGIARGGLRGDAARASAAASRSRCMRRPRAGASGSGGCRWPEHPGAVQPVRRRRRRARAVAGDAARARRDAGGPATRPLDARRRRARPRRTRRDRPRRRHRAQRAGRGRARVPVGLRAGPRAVDASRTIARRSPRWCATAPARRSPRAGAGRAAVLALAVAGGGRRRRGRAAAASACGSPAAAARAGGHAAGRQRSRRGDGVESVDCDGGMPGRRVARVHDQPARPRRTAGRRPRRRDDHLVGGARRARDARAAGAARARQPARRGRPLRRRGGRPGPDLHVVRARMAVAAGDRVALLVTPERGDRRPRGRRGARIERWFGPLLEPARPPESGPRGPGSTTSCSCASTSGPGRGRPRARCAPRPGRRPRGGRAAGRRARGRSSPAAARCAAPRWSCSAARSRSTCSTGHGAWPARRWRAPTAAVAWRPSRVARRELRVRWRNPGRRRGHLPRGRRRRRGQRTASARLTSPCSSARRASSVRFWYCGRSPTPSFANSARTWVLTPSRERCSASAISRFVAGAGAGPRSASERRAQRDQDAPLGLGQATGGIELLDERALDRRPPGARKTIVVWPTRRTSPSRRRRRPRIALAVDVRPVARQPVVDERPVRSDPLELRVRPRHLRVPVEHDVVARDAPDRDRSRSPSAAKPQVAEAVAVGEERLAAPLGLEHRLLLGRRQRMRNEAHGRILKAT